LKIGRENLIKELKEKTAEIEKSAEQYSIELIELKSHLEAIDSEITYRNLQNKKSEITDLENKLSQLQFKKSEINKQIANYNQENDELSASNKSLAEKMDKLISEIGIAENDKYQQEKVLEHFTTELENLADKLTVQKEEFNTFNLEITKIIAEISNLENESKRIDESIRSKLNSIEAREFECEEYENQIQKLKSEIESFNQDNSSSGYKPKLKLLEHNRAEIETDYKLIKSQYDVKRALIEKTEEEISTLRHERDGLINFVHENQMKLTKSRLEINEHKTRIKEEYEIDIEYKKFEDEAVFDLIRLKAEADRLRHKLKSLGGTAQLELNLYEQEKEELEKLLRDREDLVKAEEDLINLINEINKTAQDKFRETFEKIRQNFVGIFRELFMEGDESDLRLVIDPENPDPLEAKIDIMAKPRGKRPQLIDLLSGGEKTLTAIALLFAIYQVKPSPFCILDEVDAPLDDANIDRFIKIIRKFSEDTQFIIVTHNKRTMEAADSMYGVTMAEQGISTIVNVKFSDQKIAS
jgi:chromosome segregation protein